MKINFRIPEYIKPFIDKYKYPIIVFAVGFLLVLSGGMKNDEVDIQSEKKNVIGITEIQIKEALEKIDGVDRAEVVLTLKHSEQNVYAKENTRENQEEIVVVNENGGQKALIEYTSAPQFKGALIVCDGGDNSKVRLEVTDAVKALTGISSQNIIITKMKK